MNTLEDSGKAKGKLLNPSPRKCVFLIIDGLGDLPVKALNERTPLEAAKTPVLNRMAASGRYGLVDPLAPGIVPNTHSGCGMLLGVHPDQAGRMSRGPVEAAGAGRVLIEGEVALRANFATLLADNKGLGIRDRRAGRIIDGTGELADALDGLPLGDGVKASLEPTDQHRAVLVLNGPDLHGAVSDTDPGDDSGSLYVQTCRPLAPGAEATAAKINRFVTESHALLAAQPFNIQREAAGQLPANGVITRGAGAAFTLDSVIAESGLKAAVVAGCNTLLGLARIMDYEVVTDSRFTADAQTDLEEKVTAALCALRGNDIAYLHVKAPDLFSHDHQAVGKRRFIERLDSALAPIEEAGICLVLSADHTTDSNSGQHTADPVPGLVFDPLEASRSRTSPVNFGESACRDGNMPRQSAHEFLMQVVGLFADADQAD